MKTTTTISIDVEVKKKVDLILRYKDKGFLSSYIEECLKELIEREGK